MTTTFGRTRTDVTRHDARHVLLVASSGGHVGQLLALRPWWEHHHRTWVTFDTEDTRSQLKGEDVVHAFHPTTRSLTNLLRNSVLAAVVLPRVGPDLVVSTGAAVAVPFFAVARVLGIPCVYIEVVDRLASATVTGRVCHAISDLFLVQWPQQLRLYPRAKVVGTLI